MVSASRYLLRGTEEDGDEETPRPLWKARPWAELKASSWTLASSFFWWSLMTGSISSWKTWAVGRGGSVG